MARFNLPHLHKTWTHKQAAVFFVLAIPAIWLLTGLLEIILPPDLALQAVPWIRAFWLVAWLALALQIIAARGGGMGDRVIYLTAIFVLLPISILIIPVLWFLLVKYAPRKRENDQLSNLEIAALLGVPITVAKVWGKLDFSDVGSHIGLSVEHLVSILSAYFFVWIFKAIAGRKTRNLPE